MGPGVACTAAWLCRRGQPRLFALANLLIVFDAVGSVRHRTKTERQWKDVAAGIFPMVPAVAFGAEMGRHDSSTFSIGSGLAWPSKPRLFKARFDDRLCRRGRTRQYPERLRLTTCCLAADYSL